MCNRLLRPLKTCGLSKVVHMKNAKIPAEICRLAYGTLVTAHRVTNLERAIGKCFKNA